MNDPIALAKQREETDRLPFIAVLEFRVEYQPQPDGTQKPIEWVTWVKKGTQNPATTDEKISRLQKWDTAEWKVIKPAYDRWKEGQNTPIDGTPLAAWPGATPGLVKALEPANIRSVEDLGRMEDSALMRIGIPGIREKQKQARAYLEAQASTAGVASEILKLREVVEAQAKLIEDLRAAMPDDEAGPIPDAPRRRGRPPKAA